MEREQIEEKLKEICTYDINNTNGTVKDESERFREIMNIVHGFAIKANININYLVKEIKN